MDPPGQCTSRIENQRYYQHKERYELQQYRDKTIFKFPFSPFLQYESSGSSSCRRIRRMASCGGEGKTIKEATTPPSNNNSNIFFRLRSHEHHDTDNDEEVDDDDEERNLKQKMADMKSLYDLQQQQEQQQQQVHDYPHNEEEEEDEEEVDENDEGRG